MVTATRGEGADVDVQPATARAAARAATRGDARCREPPGRGRVVADDSILSTMASRPVGLSSRGAALLLLLLSARVRAEDPHRFWRPERRALQKEIEERLLSLPAAAQLRAWHDLVSCEPHVAGRPGAARVVDPLAQALSGLGLEVERQELHLELPFPVGAELEIIAPRHLRLGLKEDVLPEDPWSRDTRLDPGWNAWSASGEA